MGSVRTGVVFSLFVGVAAAQAPTATKEEPRPIDFSAVPRTIAKAPAVSPDARYGLFLFGPNGEKRVWLILDRSESMGKQPGFDLLYLDRDADGDITEAGETVVAKPPDKKKLGSVEVAAATRVFAIGDFVDPGTGAKHTEFTITWTEASVRFRMLWRGDKVTFGGYGPSRDTYAQFAASPAKAPIFVPGWDRPFQFEHWMSGELERGASTDFKVFVGNSGDRRGTFSAVDDKFLPAGEAPIATLLWTDAGGKPQRTKCALPERC